MPYRDDYYLTLQSCTACCTPMCVCVPTSQTKKKGDRRARVAWLRHGDRELLQRSLCPVPFTQACMGLGMTMGIFPVGEWLLILVPTGTKIFRLRPRERWWGSFFSHLRPRQGIYPREESRGESVPARSTILKDKFKLIVSNQYKFNKQDWKLQETSTLEFSFLFYNMSCTKFLL
jgi:hypothetical protein